MSPAGGTLVASDRQRHEDHEQVAPQPSGLDWAQGSVPVPAGAISARWEHTGDAFILTVDSPPDGEGEVVVPLLGQPREIALDGQVVWRHHRPVAGVRAELRGDSVSFAGIRGNHTFAWRVV